MQSQSCTLGAQAQPKGCTSIGRSHAATKPSTATSSHTTEPTTTSLSWIPPGIAAFTSTCSCSAHRPVAPMGSRRITAERRRGASPVDGSSDEAVPRLSVWATAQTPGPSQRRRRYLAQSTKHPARLSPERKPHNIHNHALTRTRQKACTPSINR
jgi:hypothetical protein